MSEPTPPPFPFEDEASPPSDPHDEGPITVISTRRVPAARKSLTGDLRGQTLGGFELLETVGVGGMAAVILARDQDLGRQVALKILPPETADPDVVSRFKLEARAAAKLDHDNIARVYHCGEDQGLHFIAFEFVEGENLRDLIRRNGPLSPAECVHYMAQVADGLAHAASRGVVHRDIKPSNIVITPEGRAKIVDMGLARNLDPHSTQGELTQSGVTLGTFDYISPEQALEPRSADVRSDIYSLGCTFYHASTGRPPVPEGTAARKLQHHQHVAPLDPRRINPEVPDELAAVLSRMMGKRPADRYQRPEHLREHVLRLAAVYGVPSEHLPESGQAVFGDSPLPEAPRLPLAAVAAVGLMAVALALIFWGERGPDPAAPWAASGPTERPTPTPPPPVTPALPESQTDAADADELRALIANAAPRIRLTGPMYDLTSGPPIAFTGTSLTLIGVGDAPPVLRLPATRSGGMTVTPPQKWGVCRVSIKNVTLEARAADPDPTDPPAGLVAEGITRLDLERCTLASSGGAAGLAVNAGPNSVEVRLQDCFIESGAVGLAVAGQAAVWADDCVIGPVRTAAFLMRPGPAGGESATLNLLRCSAVLRAGSVVEVADGAAARVGAKACLFTGGDVAMTPAVLRQRGEFAAGTEYAGLGANGYHAVAACRHRNRLLMTFADCRADSVPVDDAAAVVFENESPWQDPNPLALLADGEPRKAFHPDLKMPDLRVGPAGRRMLGAVKVLGEALYGQLAPLAATPPSPRRRVWDPDAGPAAGPDVYPTLAAALAEVESGDTLLIRANGPVEIPADSRLPMKDDFNLTVRPEAGRTPVLTLAESSAANPSMFRLFAGRVRFENLRFRLDEADPLEDGRSIITAVGGGSCEFRSCSVTLLGGGGAGLNFVRIADPAGEMKLAPGGQLPRPRVALRDSWVRGRGDLLLVEPGRAFSLDVDNAAIALNGTVLRVEPAKGMKAGEEADVRLNRVTAYLTGHALDLVGRADNPAPAATPVSVDASSCLFVPAGPAALPLVRTHGILAASVPELIRWRGFPRSAFGYARRADLLQIDRPVGDLSPEADPVLGGLAPGRAVLPNAPGGLTPDLRRVDPKRAFAEPTLPLEGADPAGVDLSKLPAAAD